MGKSANPKVVIAPKNHMENQTFLSLSSEVNLWVSMLSIISSKLLIIMVEWPNFISSSI
jgi:hypothetical protein